MKSYHINEINTIELHTNFIRLPFSKQRINKQIQKKENNTSNAPKEVLTGPQTPIKIHVLIK